MPFNYYLFDLDGTLTDPGLGIKNSIRYALNKHGLLPLSDDTLNRFIGPPLLDSFQKYCGVNEEEAILLLKYYREYFTQKGMFENKVYPGITELLAELINRGKELFVATSKPEPFAIQILEHFELASFFSFIGGSTLDEKRTKKEEVINYILASKNLNVKDCVMVGDRIYDIDGAKCFGMKSVGVLYGYGDAHELQTADYTIEHPLNLLEVITSG